MRVRDRNDPSRPQPRGLSSPDPAGSDGVPLSLDLARADLYSLLDALARSTAERHDELVRAFELAWEDYKEQTARRSGLH
jgi:hypothetical protein